MKSYSVENITSLCERNSERERFSRETARLVSVAPDEKQLNFSDLEYYNFIHFGINTMNNKEWGKGDEDISGFCPSLLDTDQWCEVLKKSSSKAVIITAKHHDGFCLWDTKETDHCVMNTPFKKDIVKMLSESCKKYGLKLGIYLSPWDRHEETYGSDEYNEFFLRQLKELCTNYGDIFCFWFDGACGEGKNGKKQIYDWDRYYALIRELQPEAVISICGPDVRWIGNEGGKVRKEEWSVVPASLCDSEKTSEISQKSDDAGKSVRKFEAVEENLGSREVLENSENLIFMPAEADVSINIGWFWHPRSYYKFIPNRSPKKLSEIYFNTVGGNASMLLNVPPNRDGLIDDREQRILEKFTKLISEPFENEIEDFELSVLSFSGEERKIEKGEEFSFFSNECALKFKFKKEISLSAFVIQENLRFSQRIEAFELFRKRNGGYKKIFSGTVVGSKKIQKFKRKIKTEELIFAVTGTRENPHIRSVKVFG